jgi:hypothetical protein
MANNNYPFITKNELKARLADDAAFRLECLVVLYNRQTEDEQDTKETKWRNKMGFMSSHAVHGTRIAQLVVAGETLSEEDEGRVEAIVPRYTKQLAAHFRDAAKAADPELAEAGSTFGV